MRSGSSGHLLLQCTVFLTVLATGLAAASWGDRNGGYGGNGGNGGSNGGYGGGNFGSGGRGGGGGRTGFGGFSGEESRCNQTCSNGALPIGSGNWTLGGPPPPPPSCADGSPPLCSCNNGSRPTCGDGSFPQLTLPCADGSLPACPAATNPTPAATNATIQIGRGGRLGRASRAVPAFWRPRPFRWTQETAAVPQRCPAGLPEWSHAGVCTALR